MILLDPELDHSRGRRADLARPGGAGLAPVRELALPEDGVLQPAAQVPLQAGALLLRGARRPGQPRSQPHRCFPDGRCAFDPGASPLQRWGGQLPVDVVFPLRQCRLGSPGARVSCPSRPVEMLQGWNSNAYVQAKSDSCLALPVLSRARAYSDSRNERLMQEGLSPGDVRLLRGYLCALSSRPGARVFS
ncbi:unnamed protein product [Prorocentrum cordatum]|uniref:Uncharacterized protein n=1 Tax=Prorocentrum cordatum TaxID=2364126 RepID=A0ABN9V468_9DINO|nr:unnamed protein product [Polarella glacialis]